MRRTILVAFAVWSAATVPAIAAIVHPGDRVTVSIYNHPEMVTQTTVDADGTLSVPLAGPVRVGGDDNKVAARRIADALRPYMRHPAVDLTVQQPAAAVYVSGGPGGSIPAGAGQPLASAVASLTIPASVDLRHVTLQRGGTIVGNYDVEALRRAGDGGPVLQAGDTIALRAKSVAVAVRGDVKTPGAVYVRPGETLGDALAQAGGPNQDAATGMIRLTRDGVPATIALANPLFAQPAQDGDVLELAPARHVAVTGVVAKPGSVALVDGTTLVAALYDAGGPLHDADLNHVAVMHGTTRTVYNVTAVEHGDASVNPVLQDGDLVFVPQGRRINPSSLFSGLGALRWVLP